MIIFKKQWGESIIKAKVLQVKQRRCLRVFLLFSFYLIVFHTHAQTLPPLTSPHKVTKVIFHQPSDPEKWIVIRDDLNTKDLSGPESTEAWLQSEEQPPPLGFQNPVAYVSGTIGKVEAEFNIDCTVENWYARGQRSDGFDLEVMPLDPIGTTSAKYPATFFAEEFDENKVQFWQSFEIDWYVSKDPELPEGQWVFVGRSMNPLYITFKAPEPTLEQLSPGNPTAIALSNGLPVDPVPAAWGYKHFHTLFKISCEAANGKTTDTEIISSLKTKFNTLSIWSADANRLISYYKNWDIQLGPSRSVNTVQLLNKADSQCGGWLRFFLEMLKVQGVTYSTVNTDHFFFKPQPSSSGANRLFIKNWSFNTGSLSDYAPDPFDYVFIEGADFYEGNKYNWVYADGEDTDGNDGQGNNSYPVSIFENHQLTLVGGTFYDPSYGLEYSVLAGLDGIETALVAGYAKIIVRQFNELDEGIDFNQDGEIEDISVEKMMHVVSTELNLFQLEGDLYNH